MTQFLSFGEIMLRLKTTGHAVSLLIKGRLAKAGIDHYGYSGYSFRSGFVTSAAQASRCIMEDWAAN